MVFAAYPDYCDPGKPFMQGENQPTAASASAQEGEKQPAVANEEYCKPGAARKIGNLPFTARSGVHAADDVVLTAMGPGANILHGRVDNAFVFRAMARALGLGADSPATDSFMEGVLRHVVPRDRRE
jgi:alkaline phosphatase